MKAVVVDSWPLVTAVAGAFAQTQPPRAAERFRKLCVAQGNISFGNGETQALLRYMGEVTLWTTGCVIAEAFHHLREAAGDRFEMLVAWVRERFPPPNVFSLVWSDILDSPATNRFGATDGSVVAATDRIKEATLLLQDHALHGWCLARGIPVQTCLEVIGWPAARR